MDLVICFPYLIQKNAYQTHPKRRVNGERDDEIDIIVAMICFYKNGLDIVNSLCLNFFLGNIKSYSAFSLLKIVQIMTS